MKYKYYLRDTKSPRKLEKNICLILYYKPGLDSLAPERKNENRSYSAAFLLPILHTTPAHQHILNSNHSYYNDIFRRQAQFIYQSSVTCLFLVVEGKINILFYSIQSWVENTNRTDCTECTVSPVYKL
jgi:hypothetical protein